MPNAIQKILVTFETWEQEFIQAATHNGYSGNLVFSEDESIIQREITTADVVVIGHFNAKMLRAGKPLCFIQTCSGGVNDMLFPELVESPVPIACLKPVFNTVGGEHALATMLYFARRFHYRPQSSPMTQWDNGYDELACPIDLEGNTVGIIGMGNMGQGVAKRARCFGMRVLGMSRTGHHAADADAIYTIDQRAEFLSACDFVVIAVPQTADTKHLINSSFLELMKSTAYLIDCSGRPAIFDYPALERAISDNSIAGVALQPGGGVSQTMGTPAPHSAFWIHPNVLVSSCRGTSVDTNEKARNLLFENVRRYETGEPLLGLVDKQTGY